MIWLGAYIGTIIAANWAVATFGVIPVGFGFVAPAAVLFAGLALGFRDLVQDQFGRPITIGAIVIGAIISAFVSPTLALASGSAFLLSELADLFVYTPLRERNWQLAIAASNAVGLVVDSIVFLWLAFGSLSFLAGQILGKSEITVAFLIIGTIWRRRAVLSRYAST